MAFLVVRGCFNPRPREAGDLGRRAVRAGHGDVSIHARARRATVRRSTSAPTTRSFNPRPREAGDVVQGDAAQTLSALFQSTPARGGRRTGSSPSPASRAKFQSTPSRGGRPAHSRAAAPAWPVSIHARARRATTAVPEGAGRGAGFNPRPREAGDVRAGPRLVHGRNVSIHARARRATNTSAARSGVAKRFNPRPREAGDQHRARILITFW